MKHSTFLKLIPVAFLFMIYLAAWGVVIHHEITDQMNFVIVFIALQLTMITLGMFVVLLAFLIKRAEGREKLEEENICQK